MGDSKFGFGSGVCRSPSRIVDDGKNWGVVEEKIQKWLQKNFSLRFFHILTSRVLVASTLLSADARHAVVGSWGANGGCSLYLWLLLTQLSICFNN